MALSPNAGLKQHRFASSDASLLRQNGAKPECGIETGCSIFMVHSWHSQNGAKPECGIETTMTRVSIEASWSEWR